MALIVVHCRVTPAGLRCTPLKCASIAKRSGAFSTYYPYPEAMPLKMISQNVAVIYLIIFDFLNPRFSLVFFGTVYLYTKWICLLLRSSVWPHNISYFVTGHQRIHSCWSIYSHLCWIKSIYNTFCRSQTALWF